VVNTSDQDANNILNAIFSTGAAVALIATLFLVSCGSIIVAIPFSL